jgi:hypothetical protein
MVILCEDEFVATKNQLILENVQSLQWKFTALNSNPSEVFLLAHFASFRLGFDLPTQ